MSRFILSFPCIIFFTLFFQSPATGQIYHVAEMNTTQIGFLDKEKTVVILPGGVMEQHGPFMPCFSDGYLNERLSRDVADAIVVRVGQY